MPTVRRDDGGFTLVELAAAMSVMTVVLLVFFTAVRIMATSTSRVYGSTASQTQVRAAGDVLGRQVGFATAANLPVYTNASWYFEFESDNVKAGSDQQCTQWRYQTSTGLLQYRSWSVVTNAVTSWVTVASSMVNDAVTQPPFTLRSSDAGFALMRLTVDLRLTGSGGSIAQSQAQYSLRNSASAPVPTTSTVCTQQGRP